MRELYSVSCDNLLWIFALFAQRWSCPNPGGASTSLFTRLQGRRAERRKGVRAAGDWTHTGAAASKAKEKSGSREASYSKDCVLGHGPGVPGIGLVSLQTRG